MNGEGAGVSLFYLSTPATGKTSDGSFGSLTSGVIIFERDINDQFPWKFRVIKKGFCQGCASAEKACPAR
jgi:hypothetical protein